ncbi:rhodanese-like domain-containing protein [Paenibacillus tarimensis]
MLEGWQDIDAKRLLKEMDAGLVQPRQIVDVRELPEWEYYRMEGTTHIPMNTIPDHWDRLSTVQPLYIICAHGVRSVAVCRYLSERGHSGLRNVSGGMAAVASLKGFQYD